MLQKPNKHQLLILKLQTQYNLPDLFEPTLEMSVFKIEKVITISLLTFNITITDNPNKSIMAKAVDLITLEEVTRQIMRILKEKEKACQNLEQNLSAQLDAVI